MGVITIFITGKIIRKGRRIRKDIRITKVRRITRLKNNKGWRIKKVEE